MNVWPEGENFLRPSFNPPIETPDVDPDAGVLITVAYNAAWTAALEGAVDQLRQYAGMVGTHDEKIVNIGRVNTLMALLACDIGKVDAPYWDDEEDVGESEPTDTQPWYGEVTNPTAPPDELDFVENIIVWTFTGLLAVATPELGFAPAILFHTLAPKLIIAQRRGDFATVIDIFVNGAHQAHVDTTGNSEGDIIEIPVIVGDDGGDMIIMNTLP